MHNFQYSSPLFQFHHKSITIKAYKIKEYSLIFENAGNSSCLGCQKLMTESCVLPQKRYFSSAETEQISKGQAEKHEFKAETRMLLDIVARSLYSENEVFVRELISNASDALEKFRYTIQTAGEEQNLYESVDRSLEIHLITNKQELTLTIKDTGIGIC